MKSSFPTQIELQSLPDPNYRCPNNKRAQPFFFFLSPDVGCGMWDLAPWPGTEPGPPALGEHSQQQHRLQAHPSPQSSFQRGLTKLYFVKTLRFRLCVSKQLGWIFQVLSTIIQERLQSHCLTLPIMVQPASKIWGCFESSLLPASL